MTGGLVIRAPRRERPAQENFAGLQTPLTCDYVGRLFDFYPAGDGSPRTVCERTEEGVWTQANCQPWYLKPRSGRLSTISSDQMNRFHGLFETFNDYDYASVEDQ